MTVFTAPPANDFGEDSVRHIDLGPPVDRRASGSVGLGAGADLQRLRWSAPDRGVGDLGRFARQLQRIDLDDDEQIVDAWVAGVPYGDRSNATKTGGTLVLTDRRLIFEPLNVPLPTVPRNDPTRRDEAFQSWIDESHFALALRDVRAVEADAHRRSALVIVGAVGSRALNVGASRASWVFSKKNVVARDAALAAISGAVERARSDRGSDL